MFPQSSMKGAAPMPAPQAPAAGNVKGAGPSPAPAVQQAAQPQSPAKGQAVPQSPADNLRNAFGSNAPMLGTMPVLQSGSQHKTALPAQPGAQLAPGLIQPIIAGTRR